MGDVDYFIKNYDEEVWRTISIVTIDGEPHAYQQKRIVGRPKYENSHGKTDLFGSVMVDTDEHRFVPVSETVDEEESKEIVNRNG